MIARSRSSFTSIKSSELSVSTHKALVATPGLLFFRTEHWSCASVATIDWTLEVWATVPSVPASVSTDLDGGLVPTAASTRFVSLSDKPLIIKNAREMSLYKQK